MAAERTRKQQKMSQMYSRRSRLYEVIAAAVVITSTLGGNQAYRLSYNREDNQVHKCRHCLDFETNYYHSYADEMNAEMLAVERPGDVTDSSSCGDVVRVTESLRLFIHPDRISPYYQKFTQAYGIPVLGSMAVPDAALSRACYVLRFLLADRQDLRQAYYKSFGRVVVISRQETLRDVPELAPLLEGREPGHARSLGAVPLAPITVAAEENVLCYADHPVRGLDDSLLRSLAIGILNLGAVRAEPGIKRDLTILYHHALASGWWSNTYAEHSPEMYFGEGVQSFFNANAYAHPANGFHNEINTRTKLGSYDSALFAFIRRFFPCANNYIKRCNNRGNEAYVTIPMDCPPSGWNMKRRNDY